MTTSLCLSKPYLFCSLLLNKLPLLLLAEHNNQRRHNILHALFAACAVLVKYVPIREFGLLAVEPTIMMQPPKCVVEVWFNPNLEFGQHVVEQMVMTLHSGIFVFTCTLKY